jgi:hypothetical protein
MSGRLKKIGKFFWYACLSLAVVALGAHLIWKYSGSNEWKLVRDKKGIRVYERKVPGKTVKEFKGVTRVTAKMDPFVALLLDPHACDLGDDGCYEPTTLQKVDEQHGGTGYYSFKWKYPFQFQPREYVVKTTFSQDPRTKEVFETVEAAPDKLPANDCCVRITHMRNTWRLMPLQNGQIQVEYVVDAPGGGFFPYLLDNAGGAGYMHYILRNMPKWMENERYKNADVAFIAEK